MVTSCMILQKKEWVTPASRLNINKKQCEKYFCNLYVSHGSHYASTGNCHLHQVVKNEWGHKGVQRYVALSDVN